MKLIARLILILLIPAAGFAQAIPLPEINAESAILLDYGTSAVLYEKNPDISIPPASMTKLMSIHTALNFVRNGEAGITDTVEISDAADFRSLPPRSSLMFIEKGQKVSLLELLQGLALPSGNDAAIAVAEYLCGSVESFVAQMNSNAAELGLANTEFHDASGLSELNRTTARDFAEFCRFYIAEDSEYLEKLHLPLSFTYPAKQNLPPDGKSVYGPITQPNHNLLIGRLSWADGLKTGYIDESGYNFAATAENGGRRLVLVTMGGPGDSSYDGSLRRVIDASVLLTYGFYAWTEFVPKAPANERLRVSGGSRDYLAVEFSRPPAVLVKTDRISDLRFITHYNTVTPPVSTGKPVGSWELVLDDSVLSTGLLMAGEDMQRGNIIRRIREVFIR